MLGLEPRKAVLETAVIPFHHTPIMYYYTVKMDYIPQLNQKQLDRLSEFLANFSLLIVATLVLPNIFGLDKPNIGNLLSGMILTILFLLISMVLLMRTKR